MMNLQSAISSDFGPLHAAVRHFMADRFRATSDHGTLFDLGSEQILSV
jgi:hypothetical protein